MIARFTILLPYFFHVRAADRLEPINGSLDGYDYRIYPPQQAEVSVPEISRDTPLMSVIDRLVPRQETIPDPLVTINGSPTIESNLLQIDFVRDNFDRRIPQDPNVDPTSGDPPTTVAFKIINGLLRKIRSINHSTFARELMSRDVFWRFQYLDDSGAELEELDGFFRQRWSVPYREHLSAIEATVWAHVSALSQEFQPSIWDKLLLDADAALPDVGAAVVLAATALETIAKAVVDHLAVVRGVPGPLWTWINDRDHFLKEPSVEERLDRLLVILGEQSLKTQLHLWEAFKNLKQARNNCVHEGRPAIGGTLVTQAQTSTLIDRAAEVVAWLEQFLPVESRRVGPAPPLQWNVQRPIV